MRGQELQQLLRFSEGLVAVCDSSLQRTAHARTGRTTGAEGLPSPVMTHDGAVRPPDSAAVGSVAVGSLGPRPHAHSLGGRRKTAASGIGRKRSDTAGGRC